MQLIIRLDDKRGGMVVFANTLAANGVIARAAQTTRLLLIPGRALKEPVAQTAGS